MAIFGNGSAGNRQISVDTTFDASEFNLQYRDFTIDAGVTLTIPSGATIRCLATFTNNGTVIVPTAAAGGQYGNFSSSTIDGANRPAHPGVTAGAAGTGAIDPGTVFHGSGSAVGGKGGIGLHGFAARQLLNPGPYGGGGGAASYEGDGAAGGGSLVIFAASGIVNSNTGIIRAAQPEEPTFGAGGGGGGWLIFGSSGFISNAGSIEADGGNAYHFGAASFGPGGGGGGGLVHFVAPHVTVGSVSVAGGKKGANAPGGGNSPVVGGSGGGASYGNGGDGSSVNNDNPENNATDGQPGTVFASQMQPIDEYQFALNQLAVARKIFVSALLLGAAFVGWRVLSPRP
jgi:hypothetical protein